MMLCGHIHGEGRRQDIFEGRTVHTFLQDYQDRTGAAGGFGGGDGWLRYYIFSPPATRSHAKTYRTTSGEYETDADSQFTISYDMGRAPRRGRRLGTVNSSGGAVTIDWTGLAGSTEYEWYAAVSDGIYNIGSTVRRFTTAPNARAVRFAQFTGSGCYGREARPSGLCRHGGGHRRHRGQSRVFRRSRESRRGCVRAFHVRLERRFPAPTRSLPSPRTTKARAPTSAVVDITVTNPSNVAPSVSITTPAEGASVPGGNVALAASASDADGVVSKVEFFHGAVEIRRGCHRAVHLQLAGRGCRKLYHHRRGNG